MTISYEPDPDADIQRLVGKFLQRFARLERELDKGIGKLLGINDRRIDIVCANLTFAKKIDLLFSAENYVAEIPKPHRSILLKKTRNEILKINDHRVVFAHNEFFKDDHGNLAFSQNLARKELKNSIHRYSDHDISELCEKIENLRKSIIALIENMQPFQPGLDYSDPRNSSLAALFW